jgi:hypothetical protein
MHQGNGKQCYILALRCNNTLTLSLSVHYNYILTLCHFQLSILHTHTDSYRLEM